MPHKNDENHALKPIDLTFILAIAGRIDAQSRLLAQKLDNGRHVYYGYAALDSLSSSYSMFKYFFDVFADNTSADHMHDVMLSPAGIASITAESIFLVTFSMLACKFDNEKHDAVKKFIAASWPYFRDVIKGLKNAYKGWRSTMQAASFLSGINLRHLVVPIGLALGIFAAANRLWIRSMIEARKVMMSENAELLVEIKQLLTLDVKDFDHYLNKRIKHQSEDTRYGAFAAVAAGGLVDGLYLYVGVLSLAILTPHLFIAMTVMSAIFSLACIITRVYEEYDFQVRLFITQTKCKLGLITKEIELTYAILLDPEKNGLTEEDIKKLKAYLGSMLDQFEEARQLLHQQTNRSPFTAALLGLKFGLYAYSALASILFLIGTIFVLSSAAFPPALLIFCVSLGMAFMIGFIAQSLWVNSQKPTPKDNFKSTYGELTNMRDLINNDKPIQLMEMEEFKKSLKDGLILTQPPQFFYQEWFEVIRSFFSGVGKGQKFVDFAFNPMQEIDEQGHYHDTPAMFILSAFSAALFAFTLALRALARGLGRPPLGQVDLAADVAPAQPQEKIESEEKAANQEQKSIDHIQRSQSVLRFFQAKPAKTPNLPHSNSTADFTRGPTVIQGLG